jgi:hypothetical protein
VISRAALRRGGPAPAHSGLVAPLMECHGRIRAVAASLRALAGRGALDSPAAVSTATQVARYLRIALPLHAADEEQSVAPRLCALRPELAAQLDQIADEHAEIEELVGRALPGLDGTAPLDQTALRALAAALHGHIEGEERLIFPLIDALSPAEQAAALAELRARRAMA